MYVPTINIEGGTSNRRPEEIQFKGGIIPIISGLHGNFSKIPTLKVGIFLLLPVNKPDRVFRVRKRFGAKFLDFFAK